MLGISLINAAAKAEIIDQEEATQLRDYDALVMEVINVDEFPFDGFAREAITAKKTTRKKTSKEKTKRVTKKVAKKVTKKVAKKDLD